MKYIWFYENSLHGSGFSENNYFPEGRTATAQIGQGWLLRPLRDVLILHPLKEVGAEI